MTRLSPRPLLHGDLQVGPQTAVLQGLPIGGGRTFLHDGRVFFEIGVTGRLLSTGPRLLVLDGGVLDGGVQIRHLLPEQLDLSPLIGQTLSWRSVQGVGHPPGFWAELRHEDRLILRVWDMDCPLEDVEGLPAGIARFSGAAHLAVHAELQKAAG